MDSLMVEHHLLKATIAATRELAGEEPELVVYRQHSSAREAHYNLKLLLGRAVQRILAIKRLKLEARVGTVDL